MLYKIFPESLGNLTIDIMIKILYNIGTEKERRAKTKIKVFKNFKKSLDKTKNL